MAETVKINIETVGTQQAAAQTKTLKQQIKDLRTELEGLTAGTEEYNQKITELGNLMHTQSEITEQAKMATQDYGQTLSNITGVASGVVGSISAVNGVMNLVGASSDDAMKAMKDIQSLMAIVQGLGQLENAEKSFKSLLANIKLNTKAKKENTQQTIENTTSENTNTEANVKNSMSMKTQTASARGLNVSLKTLGTGFKSLGAAIKSFMMSNPFTAIVVAVTTIYTVISSILGKINKAREEALEAIRETADIYSNIDEGKLDDAAMAIYGEEMFKKRKFSNMWMLETVEEFDKEIEKMDNEIAKQKVKLAEAITNNLDTETLQKELDKKQERYRQLYILRMKKFIEDLENSVNDPNWFQRQLIANEEMGRAINKFLGLDPDFGNFTKILKNQEDFEKAINDNKGKLQKLFTDYGKFVNNLLNGARDEAEAQRKKEEAERQARLAALEKAKSDALKIIQQKKELDTQLAENAYANEETTTEEHYARLKEIEDTYYAEYADIMNGNMKVYKKYIAKYNKKQQEVELATANHEAALINIERKTATELQKIRAWQTDPSRDIALSRADREKDDAIKYYNQVRSDNQKVAALEMQTRQQMLDFDAAWFMKKMAMLDNYNRESIKKEREAAIESLRIQQERKEQEIAILGTDYDQNLSDENAQYEHDLQMLREQYEKKLITQQQYEQKGEELTNEHLIRLRELETSYTNDIAQAEMELSDTRLQIQREEFAMEQELFEQKKAMIKSYISAFSSITSAVSSLLSEVQSQYEEGSKQYEKIAEAMLIMQTIEGSLAAFVSGVESGLPAPWNFALGAVLAGLATATGVMAIQNLKSKKLSSSAANAPNVSPYETLSYETNSNIEGNIQDSRCYVLESDITSTQNRVSVAEDEASF